MKLVYANSPYTEINSPSVFLAGPSPRDAVTRSWRPEAIKCFKSLGFNGTLFIPEFDGSAKFDYYNQVEWEWEHLHIAKVIMFWVPRAIPSMMALTTNVEFGRYVSVMPEKCVYGRPDDSERNSYLDWLFEKITNRKPFDTLISTVEATIGVPNG